MDRHTSCINAFAVKWYCEAEFWLALGKVFLILIIYMFTFITMVGGNPKTDAYGFRYCGSPHGGDTRGFR
jgi:amino acid transporter